jgi:hypothetical protein
VSVRAGLLLLAGAAIAFVGALCGIGGGLFAVPMLHYLFRLDLRASVATSLCLVAATAWSSTATELLRPDSALVLSVVLPLALGALAGAQLGYRISRRLDERRLKAVFAAVLLLAGARMLLLDSIPAGPTEVAGGSPLVLGALIGAGAGTVAPLLGIGGGLVVVPALMFTMPGLGALAVRAASLAVACVTSARSIQLYAGEGIIRPALGLPIALGALVGASLGVHTVHLPGMSEVGQRVMGGILVLTALRFARDVARPRSPGSGEAADGAAE